MFSEAQLLYLTEVLGTDPVHFARAARGPAAYPVVVWTPPLSGDERALLGKILASVGLGEVPRVEGGEFGPCRHRVRFAGEAMGRFEGSAGTTWEFHDLASMLGDGPAVGRLKRDVWTLLQELRREV